MYAHSVDMFFSGVPDVIVMSYSVSYYQLSTSQMTGQEGPVLHDMLHKTYQLEGTRRCQGSCF